MVWGLDKVFWWFAARTSNGKSKNKGNRWVVAPFGLHSGLRQSGSRCAAGLERPKAEALGYPEAKTKAKEEQAKARTGESKNRQKQERAKAKAKYRDLSTALWTGRLSIASVEMTFGLCLFQVVRR
jgi:hypothetical protein